MLCLRQLSYSGGFALDLLQYIYERTVFEPNAADVRSRADTAAAGSYPGNMPPLQQQLLADQRLHNMDMRKSKRRTQLFFIGAPQCTQSAHATIETRTFQGITCCFMRKTWEHRLKARRKTFSDLQ